MRAVEPIPVIAEGGIDQVSPRVAAQDGSLLYANNYEYLLSEGYRRSLGFERFDGRPAPSETPMPSPAILNDAARETAHKILIAARRTAITAVPGSGPIRGVFALRNEIYALRDNALATAKVLHQATAGGWVAVASVTTPLTAGSRCRFDLCNLDAARGKEIICADGVMHAWKWNGTGDIIKINTAFADFPNRVKIATDRVWLAYAGGSLQFSVNGQPSNWSAGSGAGEFRIEDEIEDLHVVPTGIAVMCTGRIEIIYNAASLASMRKDAITTKAGARPDSIAELGEPIFMSQNGITVLSRVQEYGNFQLGSLSNRISRRVEQDRSRTFIGAFAQRTKNQYRTMTSDGQGIIATIGGERPSFMFYDYAKDFSCLSSWEVNGKQRIFAGGADGFVYEIDKGNSFDGAAYASVLRFRGLNFGAAEKKKRIPKISVEGKAEDKATVSVYANLDLGASEGTHTTEIEAFVIYGATAVYGDSSYGQARYGSSNNDDVIIRPGITCRSAAVCVNSNSDYDSPHTIAAMNFHIAGGARVR